MYLEDKLDAALAKLDAIAAKLDSLAPAPVPTPTPTPSPLYPSDVLDLRNWTVMLPTGSDGDPDNDYMVGVSVPGVFFVDPADQGVVFRTDVVNGVHSSGSKYPRTELREMKDANWTKAAWSSADAHWLQAELAIDTGHLSVRKRVVGAQIHDSSDDVCQLMLREDGKLGLAHNDGANFEVIDSAYVSGTRFTCRIAVAANRIRVFYNGAAKVDIPKSGTSWYWKIGSYAQTGGSSTYKEPPGSYAQVKVWALATGTN